MKASLTQRYVDSTALDLGDHFDEKLTGFFLYVGKRARTYYVQRQLRDSMTGRLKSVRRKVGRVNLMTLGDARSKARTLLAMMESGIDPAEAGRRQAARSITLGEALELHLADGDHSPRTSQNYRTTCELHLRRFMTRQLAELGADRNGVRRLHRRISKESGDYAANAAIRIFRAIYNTARRQHPELPESPTINVRFNKERNRSHTAVAPENLANWHRRVLAIENPIRRDFQLFLIHTGLRRERAARVRWADIDWQLRSLFVPEPKGGADRAFSIPISRCVIEILQRRQRENELIHPGAEWVFPTRAGRGRRGAIIPIREPKEEGLPGPHALRHTYASIAYSVGVPHLALKRLLNLRSSADVTEAYVQLHIESQRGYQEMVSDFLLAHFEAMPEEPAHENVTLLAG